MDNENLRKKSLSGVIWTFLDVFINKLSFFVVSIIIARILGPEVYGLIGMITIFITIGNSLVDSGMGISLIRNSKIDDKDLSSVFIGNIGIATLVYIIFYFLAPFISIFYDQNILKNVIRVYCLIFIISAFRVVQSALILREFQFKKNTLLTIPGVLLSSVLGIFLALRNYGIWSVIIMLLINQLVFTMLLWIFSNVRFSLKFSLPKFKKHFIFGYKLTLSGLLNTAFNNLNNVLIGRFYPIQQSAYYERAYSLNQYPSNVFTAIITKVSMPVFSRIQDDKELVVRNLKILMRYSLLFISFVMLCLILFSKEIIILTLGEDWLPAVAYLKIISIAMIFLPIHMFNMNILQVYGKSDYFLKAEIYKKIFQFICVILLFKFGILWMISSLVFLSIFEIFINAYFVSKVIKFSIISQIKNISKISIFISLNLLMIFGLKEFICCDLNMIITNFIFLILLILFYVLFIYFFEKNIIQTIKNLF